jgi:ADP-ribose pyrophosphatase YjhB (NUDIX family)
MKVGVAPIMASRLFLQAASRLMLHPWFRVTRAVTLGVRAVVRDAEGRVLLVRHRYAPGWFLPGGGVERGETVWQALARELAEEAGVEQLEPARLHGLFANFERFPGDHVAVFVVEHWRREPAVSLEIAEARLFPHASLPDGASGGTRRRIAEVFADAPIGADW